MSCCSTSPPAGPGLSLTYQVSMNCVVVVSGDRCWQVRQIILELQVCHRNVIDCSNKFVSLYVTEIG